MRTRMTAEEMYGKGAFPRYTPWLCEVCRRVYWVEIGERLDLSLDELLGTPSIVESDRPTDCCFTGWAVDEGLGREQNILVHYVQMAASASFAAGKRLGPDLKPPAECDPETITSPKAFIEEAQRTGVDPPADPA